MYDPTHDPNSLSTHANGATSRMRHWWQQRSHDALDAADSMRRETMALGRRTHRQMSDAPVTSALIAAAVGAALVCVAWALTARRER